MQPGNRFVPNDGLRPIRRSLNFDRMLFDAPTSGSVHISCPQRSNRRVRHRRDMSKSSRVRTIRLPLRKICSSLPALALISGGVIFSASAAPTADIQADTVASSSPAIVVPDVALTLPAAAQVLDLSLI